jgi:glutaredoxin
MVTQAAVSQALRITLFSRRNCSLCTAARVVLDGVQQRRKFEFYQIDVMAPENSKWKLYEFDVPVVRVEICSNLR